MTLTRRTLVLAGIAAPVVAAPLGRAPNPGRPARCELLSLTRRADRRTPSCGWSSRGCNSASAPPS